MEKSTENNEVYQLYGKFLVKFEEVSLIMRFAILRIAFPNHSERQLMQNEIMAESLTAEEIRNKYISLITMNFKPETRIFNLANTISNVYERIIPIRNSFAHGALFMGASTVNKDAVNGLLLLRHPKISEKKRDGLYFKKHEIAALKHSLHLFEMMTYAIAVVSFSILNREEKNPLNVYTSNKYLDGLVNELLRMEKRLEVLLSK